MAFTTNGLRAAHVMARSHTHDYLDGSERFDLFDAEAERAWDLPLRRGGRDPGEPLVPEVGGELTR